MTSPFLLLQLSDTHIGATWGEGDPVALLAATVEFIQALPDDPDAFVITGDLADTGAREEYAALSELLDPLGDRVYPLPGNHDSRAMLRSHFALPGQNGEPVNYSVEVGPVRLVALDSTKPGEDRGELDAARLAWLDQELSATRDQMTILAMHHPPLVTGAPAWDRIGIPEAERSSLVGVLDRHPQVRLIIGGHLHRSMVSRLSSRPVLAAPAIYESAQPDFTAEELGLVGSRPAFVLHVVLDGELTSHVLTAE